MNQVLKAALAAAMALFLANQANATCTVGGPATNCPEPAGPVILDLNGTAISRTYTDYSVSFTASGTLTNLSFALRDDPAYLDLSGISMVDTTAPSVNLVANGDFSSGPVGANQPNGWTYLNQFGATYAGVVASNCGLAGGNCYHDGSVQAYDGISQAIATIAGDVYTVDFELFESSSLSTFSALSTNGDTSDSNGNGINLVVYAGNIPTAAPEPMSLALLGVGLAGLGLVRNRRKTA
jgi:hypothetical protein